MPVCKKCKTHNILGVKSCKKCGHIIPVDEGNPCPKCSNINGPFAKQCKKCGYQLQKVNVKVNVPNTRTKEKIYNDTQRTKGLSFNNLMKQLIKDKNKGYFSYNELNSLNAKNDAQHNINFLGEVDHFTKSTLYENYNELAKYLKVYPTIDVLPRNSMISGGFGGLYHSERNHIEIVNTYYLISVLAHEMRHAFQYIYIPDFFFNTEYYSVQSYLNARIEKDARQFSIDYCHYKGYFEEKSAMENYENKVQLCIQGKLSFGEIGITDADYFSRNPFHGQQVSRKYHRIQQTTQVQLPQQTTKEGHVVQKNSFKVTQYEFFMLKIFRFIIGCIKWGVISIVGLFILLIIIGIIFG